MVDTDRDYKPGKYDFSVIEKRWQKYWQDHEVFRTLNPGEPGADPSQPKFYILDMFPYPSGSGLHVGHPLGYCATDIIARFKRMRGFNVLHPMGFDSFGLPAEQYAIETGVHPEVTTKKNLDMYRKQLKMFGFSYDWSRELATSDPSYYKFTQWSFSRMFESWFDDQCRGIDANGTEVVGKARPIGELLEELQAGRWGVNATLQIVRDRDDVDRVEWSELSKLDKRQVINNQRLAYLDEVPVNWCPELGTVLSNEEVDNQGRSERGGHPVYRRPLKQWMMRITKYAERLIGDLDELDWPEPIKLMQRNWVGKSQGALVAFPLAKEWALEDGRWKCLDDGASCPASFTYDNFPNAIRIYTTRHDTLFGATYMVLAPEHDLVDRITTPEHQEKVADYVSAARNRSDLERTSESKEKTGVFTGAYAINPVNGCRIPIWVADYVLAGYGTGAIMAVPSGDTRDYEFACKFDLPIVPVVKPSTEWIEQRLNALLDGIDGRASDGLEGLGQEFPELKETINARRESAAELGKQTLNVLTDRVGIERLSEHFIKHPKTWGEAFVGEGVAVNSPSEEENEQVPGGICELNGLETSAAKTKMADWLEQVGVGRAAVNYKLRDWVFSRQKYWGEPFPVLHDEDGDTIAVCDEDLPVVLPPMENFKPTPVADDSAAPPEPPLGRAKEWVRVEQDGKSYRRDLNTMPQWAGSCWYYLRFIDPHNDERFCDAEAEKYWMPIDLYVGGAEHAVLHLLYARFWHKVLFDLGFVSTREPFAKLFNQGMIQSFAYRDKRGLVVGPDHVKECGDDQFVMKSTGEPVARIVAKMSKALKNVVNPDEIIGEYGADTFRLYEMYMGPLDAAKPWNTRDVPGLSKLCQRIWRLIVDETTNELSASLTDQEPDTPTQRVLHKMVKRVTTDLEQMKFNTAIAAIFDFVNAMTPKKERPRSVMEPFLLVLAPFAPHLAEELWSRLGHEKTLAFEPWPGYDESLACDDEIEIAVQVLGKIKSRVTVAADADEKAIELAALADDHVKEALQGKTIRKVIVVKGRLVNVVAT